MGYESLSTVVVLVILMVIAVGWLPRRTVNSMKKVAEHRQDRYSSSLHLVDADSGTRFSDEHTPQPKGAIMQRAQTSTTTPTTAKVAHIRELRRAAVRRRRILALSLLLITVLVLVLSMVLPFSALFALIPGVLLAVVLALGVRASSQARRWEHALAEARRRERLAKRAGASARPRAKSPSQAKSTSPDKSAAKAIADTAGDQVTATANPSAETEVKTDVMERREIRQALHRARIEQDRALAAREARQKAHAMAASENGRHDVDAASEQPEAAVTSAVQPEPRQDVVEPADSHAEVVVEEGSAPSGGDMTTELDRVHPAAALDAFEVAASQDLISFSLGEPRNGVDRHAPAPESLEIKSTKQVAKAVPALVAEQPTIVDGGDAGQSDADATVAAVMDDASVNDTDAFHQTEVRSSVDAPDASSDSLGTGLEAILARRSS
ncbi:hypothetical protein PL742_00610 [Bifidobacterium bifidum]|uniref:hypothetical protein n=1 Tax=Bifidobacterium bifidum TaxID=1681 RepID=UPI00232CD651|nr:hypothetical protein [Bifidobacterium bifidum]MDB1217236.1 hypothetical protein [Bifidobacterium bifidum]